MKMVTEIVLYVVGVLALVEGIYLTIFSDSARKVMLNFAKNEGTLSKLSKFELILGILLMIMGTLV